MLRTHGGVGTDQWQRCQQRLDSGRLGELLAAHDSVRSDLCETTRLRACYADKFLEATARPRSVDSIEGVTA